MSLPSFSLGWRSFFFRGGSLRRASAFRQIALGVAFTLSVAVPSAAQMGTGGSGGGGGTGGTGGGGGSGGGAMTGAGGSDDGADCMTTASMTCQERCPTFDTCSLEDSRGQLDSLYYRVDGQRFDCDGLRCIEAAALKDDYCCERGEFAPKDDDDGGCTLTSAPGTESNDSGGSATWLSVAVGIGALGLARARRRVRHISSSQQQRR